MLWEMSFYRDIYLVFWVYSTVCWMWKEAEKKKDESVRRMEQSFCKLDLYTGLQLFLEKWSSQST